MQLTTTCLKTARLILTPPLLADAEAMLDYYLRNRLGFQPWEPRRDESFYTLEGMRARISAMTEKMLAQQSLHLLLRMPGSAEILGECGFTNIVRGPFQACHLGFSVGQGFEGKGLMAEALRCAIGFVFDELALHRVMANYRPENERSHRLLQRLGFEQEGLARAYLNIDGAWRDHILSSLINENQPSGHPLPNGKINI
jgi:ribosomal-protein-alanine N-acetyltransferase